MGRTQNNGLEAGVWISGSHPSCRNGRAVGKQGSKTSLDETKLQMEIVFVQTFVSKGEFNLNREQVEVEAECSCAKNK